MSSTSPPITPILSNGPTTEEVEEEDIKGKH